MSTLAYVHRQIGVVTIDRRIERYVPERHGRIHDIEHGSDGRTGNRVDLSTIATDDDGSVRARDMEARLDDDVLQHDDLVVAGIAHGVLHSGFQGYELLRTYHRLRLDLREVDGHPQGTCGPLPGVVERVDGPVTVVCVRAVAIDNRSVVCPKDVDVVRDG